MVKNTQTLYVHYIQSGVKSKLKSSCRKAKEYSTVFDRMTDNIADAASTFADYLTDGSNSVLQRSVDNQTKLKIQLVHSWKTLLIKAHIITSKR